MVKHFNHIKVGRYIKIKNKSLQINNNLALNIQIWPKYHFLIKYIGLEKVFFKVGRFERGINSRLKKTIIMKGLKLDAFFIKFVFVYKMT